MSLSTIFKQKESTRLRKFAYCIHVGDTAVKVNHQNSLGARRTSPFQFRWVHIAGCAIRLHKDWHKTCRRHGKNRRDKRIRRNEHLVAPFEKPLQNCSTKYQGQGVKTVPYTHAMPYTTISGKGILEFSAAGTANKPIRIENFPKRSL